MDRGGKLPITLRNLKEFKYSWPMLPYPISTENCSWVRPARGGRVQTPQGRGAGPASVVSCGLISNPHPDVCLVGFLDDSPRIRMTLGPESPRLLGVGLMVRTPAFPKRQCLWEDTLCAPPPSPPTLRCEPSCLGPAVSEDREVGASAGSSADRGQSCPRFSLW